MRPHVVFLTSPTTGQINPMLELAQLLHSNGFYITFVDTESSHHKIVQSKGVDALQGTDDFKFESIPDGFSADKPSDTLKLILSLRENGAAPFRELLQKLNSSSAAPPVTCIIGNFLMIFAVDVAEELGFPLYVFWTTSASGLLGSLQLQELVKRDYIPLKDESYLTNGYLDTPIDWVPGLKDVRLRDFSGFVRTTNNDDIFLKEEIKQVNYALRTSGVILNTFDIEAEVIDALKSYFSRVYAVGPLTLLLAQIDKDRHSRIRLNHWKEDSNCKQWLDSQRNASVIYVSFGSLAILTPEQLEEFAWGLADSKYPFFWIIRPDLVHGGINALPKDFIEETERRSYFSNWCHQSEVLSHSSVGGFLGHGGWNSMLEAIYAGVPMTCWPGFSDQYMNCRYGGKRWGIMTEIDKEVKREQVKELLEELMEGEKGQKMRRNIMKWKQIADEASIDGGNSDANLKKLMKDLNTS